MTTISQDYIEQNRALHEQNYKYGTTGNQWAYYISELVRTEGHQSVCDWGAGKGVLKGMLGEFGVHNVAEYDPAIPGKDARPEPADLVVATDVLEHVQPEYLLEVMTELARLTQKKLFVDICTTEALKTLPDGRNAHLIVQNPDWWRYTLSRHFDVVHWVERPELNTVYGECVPKGMGKAEKEANALRPKRRKLSLELSSMCGRLLAMSKASHDELGRVRSIRFYERDGDEAADTQIVWDTLDDVAFVEPELEKIVRLGRKGVILRVALDGGRTEAWWRPKIEQHWHIVDWVHDANGLGIVGIPKVTVAGIKVVGAVNHEERWGQIEAAISRFPKRIQPAEPHGRRAIVACYGPSLGEMIPRIKEEMEEALCEVVSVSGSHDYLLEHAIVPTYHVECDPRPHKADNIDRPQLGVQYLMGSVVHPVVFDKLDGCNVALWHVADTEHVKGLLAAGEKPRHIITGGGSVGLRAISLLYSMGYRDFSIYAMDCSFAEDGRQWAGKHAGKQSDQMVISTDCAGRVFSTSPVLLSYATDFLEMVQKMDAQIRIYGDGLLQRMCRLHNSMAAQPREDGTVDRMGFAFPAHDKEWRNIYGSCTLAVPALLAATPGRRVAIQAGGNVGVLPQLLSEHFGTVITLEPDAENFACLQRNVTSENVIQIQAALGEAPGTASLTRKPANCGGHYINGHGKDIAVETIDCLGMGLDACDLIVLDVEGCEMQALKGAEQTIARFKPAIMIEDNGLSERYGTPKGATPQWLVDRFGYRVKSANRRDVILTWENTP
jgi:FkbM family methyltransferase